MFMQREYNDWFNFRRDIRQDCVSLSAPFTHYLEKKKKKIIFSQNTRVIGRKLESMYPSLVSVQDILPASLIFIQGFF